MGKKAAIPETHKAPMLLASIDPESEMEVIAAALRTKDADNLSWEYVTTTLIDEFDVKYSNCSKKSKTSKIKDEGRHTGSLLESAYESNHEITHVALARETVLKEPRRNSFSSVFCEFCAKKGQDASRCYFNSENPKNKLTTKMKERMLLTSHSRSKRHESRVKKARDLPV